MLLSRLNLRWIASLRGLMPSCGGYLVSPASADLCAASIACLGDMKSGSPDERPTILTPWARSSRTLRVMAAEADTLTFFRRSAGSNMGPRQWRRTIEEASAGYQPRGLDACNANGLILFAGATACAGRADHLALFVLDDHRAGLRNEFTLRRG